jgi:hypothetical protein
LRRGMPAVIDIIATGVPKSDKKYIIGLNEAIQSIRNRAEVAKSLG